MESLNPFLQIKMAYSTLTDTHKRCADFITRSPEFVLQNSILDVATACDVAEATISRFCRTLGYKGYHDFKISVAQSLAESKKEDISDASADAPDSPQAPAQFLLEKAIQALNETSKLINEETIQKAADLLVTSQRIMFLGRGASIVSALEGYNKFLRITPKVSINLESHMQFMAASLMGTADTAVIISHSGSTKEIVDMAKKLKQNGTKIICITRYHKSPLVKYADCALFYSSDEQLVYGYSLSGSPGVSYLLNLLYIEFFTRTQNSARINQEQSSSLLLDKLY